MSVETTLHHAVATLSDGSEVRTPYWHLDSGVAGETFLVIAEQHGNEVQGCEVIRRFKLACEEGLRRGAVILVPFANLPALRHRRSHISLGPEQPYADDSGHNMNRTWPGNPEGNDTERVAYSVHQAVVPHCTRCLDLHSWSRFTATCTLARGGHELSEAMSAVTAIRFVQETAPGKSAEEGPTQISALFNTTGRGATTIELAPQWVIREKEVREGLRAATNLAKFLGMMDGEPEFPEGPIVTFTAADREERNHQLKAPCSGLFVEAGLQTSDYVEEGQKLGHIIRDEDLQTVEIVAPVSGYLWQYGCFREHSDVALPPQHPYASEGDVLAGVMTP